MRILHTAGLDVTSAHSGDGMTPFHRACWGRNPGHTQVVRYMLDAVGVDPNLPGGNGKTCFDMTRNRHTKAVLQAYGGGPEPAPQDGAAEGEVKEEL